MHTRERMATQVIRMHNRYLKGLILAGVAILLAVSAVAEEQRTRPDDRTRTTDAYSPRGVYQELRVAGHLGVGDLEAPEAVVQVTPSKEAAEPLVLLKTADPQQPSPVPVVRIDVTGVGLGASPSAALDVVGDVFVDGAVTLPQGHAEYELVCNQCVGSDATRVDSDINKEQVQHRVVAGCSGGCAIQSIDCNGCPTCVAVRAGVACTTEPACTPTLACPP